MKFAYLSLLAAAVAHSNVKVNPDDSWQVKHMKIEHGIEDFDAYSFFTLHDNDGSKTWSREDILNLYGLLKDEQVGDGSGTGEGEQQITKATKDNVVNKILELLDTDGDGIVSLDEWRVFCQDGKVLPDFGLGTGHHGDYEHEYEVHHWNKYHRDNDPDVQVVHPEDEEHERLYHAHEHGDTESDHTEDGSFARISRIPKKFLKQTN